MSSQNTRRKVRLNEKVESRVRGDLYARFGGEYLETYHYNKWQGAGCLAYEEKQEEFFALLENYYTTVELAELFFPVVINKDRDFRKLVEAHCLQAKSVNELIVLCGYNAGCFKKTFEEVFSRPIYQWMQAQKAEHIKYRLQDVNVNFKELMAELGFDSASHFNKFCQKWLGTSPSQYVKGIKSECDSGYVDNV